MEGITGGRWFSSVFHNREKQNESSNKAEIAERLSSRRSLTMTDLTAQGTDLASQWLSFPLVEAIPRNFIDD